MKRSTEKPENLEKKLSELQAALDLDVVDKQILKIKSLDPTLGAREIAKIVGVHFSTITRRMEKKSWREAWDAINKTTLELMELNARKAAIRIGMLIGDTDKKIAIEACKLSLLPLVNNHTHTVSVKPQTVYKTTIQPDSTLLQEIIEGELGEN